MSKRSRGLRSGSRHKLSRPSRERGLSPITRSLQTFEDGETLLILSAITYANTVIAANEGFANAIPTIAPIKPISQNLITI